MQPRVTVAVPVYNGGPFLRRAIVSALNQDYEPLTVLVVDNCSTDETPQVLREFSDERLVVCRFEEHLPLAANWDRALQASAGDFVTMMSADNEMAPGAVAALADALTGHEECGMAIGRVRLVVANGHRRVSLSPSHELQAGVIDDLEMHLLTWGYNFSINAVMFRRDLPGLHFKSESGHGCDIDLLLRLGQEGVRAVAIESLIHNWLDHPDTLTSKKYDAVWKAIMDAYLNAQQSSVHVAAYKARIGKMLVWECMRLMGKGGRADARQWVQQFGHATAWPWRTMAKTITNVPGAYLVPRAVRWATTNAPKPR